MCYEAMLVVIELIELVFVICVGVIIVMHLNFEMNLIFSKLDTLLDKTDK